MSTKLKIRTNPGKVVERDVPDISLELAPEYRRRWFKDHPKLKPIIRVPKSGLSIDQLLRKMGDYWITDPDIEPTLEFLLYFIKKYIKDCLSEDWISYELTIGKKDQQITPLDLLTVEEYDTKPDTNFGAALQESEEPARFSTIMAIHRAHATMGGVGDYPTRVIKQMESTLREPSFRVSALDPGLVSAKASWGGNETYKKFVAVIDMFFNKFRDNQFSKIKVAALSSRYKDCGGLVAKTDLSSYLGEPTTKALSYAMDPRIAPELLRLTEELDEIAKPDSFFHYMRDLELSNKSPYSSSMNPIIYNFTYSVGTFMGNRRACNARLFSDAGLMNTVNLAAYVAYFFRKWMNVSIVAGDEDLIKRADAIDEIDNSEVPEEGKKDCLYIYSQILNNKSELSPEIRRELKKVVSGLTDLRDGTIGKQIQQMFT